MPVNRTLYTSRFTKKSSPSWPCMSCQAGHLRLNAKSLAQDADAASKAAGPEDWYEPTDEVLRFVALVICDNPQCRQPATMAENGRYDEDPDEYSQNMDYTASFTPTYFSPSPNLIAIPEKCPAEATVEIERAFIASWGDPAAAANHNVTVQPVQSAQWKSICQDSAGSIPSLVEILQGKLSTAIMQRICEPGKGLMPTPKEISFDCSCPDWAGMCKHVAAVLYDVGARLDQQPELLFTLRHVDAKDLIQVADGGLVTALKASRAPKAAKVLDDSLLADVFGLEMAQATDAPPAKKVVVKVVKVVKTVKALIIKKPVENKVAAKKVTAKKAIVKTIVKAVPTPKPTSKKVATKVAIKTPAVKKARVKKRV